LVSNAISHDEDTIRYDNDPACLSLSSKHIAATRVAEGGSILAFIVAC